MVADVLAQRLRLPDSRRRGRAVGVALAAAAVAAGLAGTYRYAENFWLYRGFSPPADPAWVTQRGSATMVSVASPALGGRRQQVVVYLPPGYAQHPGRRYPVFYLLHGFPGRPAAFLQTVRAGVLEDVLAAKGRMRPLLLVMPFGSTGTFTDKEWANGIRPREGWETFVARDLVRYVDTHFRTVASGGGRALGGLSEGGYGALNIGLHHPGEFRVLESWSGYTRADDLRSIFGGDPWLLRRNSPAAQLATSAAALRRNHAYVWFYSSRGDRFRHQNAAFAAALRRAGVARSYRLLAGGHDWRVWRSQAAAALVAASSHLAG